MTTTALQSEEAVLERIHKQHLIESVEQMSPAYLVEEGPCTWDDVMARWKARGPMNEQFVGMVQRGKREMLRLLEQDADDGISIIRVSFSQ